MLRNRREHLVRVASISPGSFAEDTLGEWVKPRDVSACAEGLLSGLEESD